MKNFENFSNPDANKESGQELSKERMLESGQSLYREEQEELESKIGKAETVKLVAGLVAVGTAIEIIARYTGFSLFDVPADHFEATKQFALKLGIHVSQMAAWATIYGTSKYQERIEAKINKLKEKFGKTLG